MHTARHLQFTIANWQSGNGNPKSIPQYIIQFKSINLNSICHLLRDIKYIRIFGESMNINRMHRHHAHNFMGINLNALQIKIQIDNSRDNIPVAKWFAK